MRAQNQLTAFSDLEEEVSAAQGEGASRLLKGQGSQQRVGERQTASALNTNEEPKDQRGHYVACFLLTTLGLSGN